MGLELAGEVVGAGCNVDPAMIGRRVMGIVGGGAFAEFARMDKGLAMPIPDGMDYVEAAAIPEVFLTANKTVFNLGALMADPSILIPARASGVGTAAIKMASHKIGRAECREKGSKYG